MREPNVDNGCEGKTTNDDEMTRWSLVASWSLSSGDVKLITSWHKRRSGTSRGEAQERGGLCLASGGYGPRTSWHCCLRLHLAASLSLSPDPQRCTLRILTGCT